MTPNAAFARSGQNLPLDVSTQHAVAYLICDDRRKVHLARELTSLREQRRRVITQADVQRLALRTT
jgi:hypothetical protein